MTKIILFFSIFFIIKKIVIKRLSNKLSKTIDYKKELEHKKSKKFVKKSCY